MLELITPNKLKPILKTMLNSGMSTDCISKRTGLSSTTIYKYIDDIGEHGKRRIQEKQRKFSAMLNLLMSGDEEIINEFATEIPYITYNSERLLKLDLLTAMMLELSNEEVHRITKTPLDLITMHRVNIAAEPKYKIVHRKKTKTMTVALPELPKPQIDFKPITIPEDLTTKYPIGGLPKASIYTEFSWPLFGEINAVEQFNQLSSDAQEAILRKIYKSKGYLSAEIMSEHLVFITPHLVNILFSDLIHGTRNFAGNTLKSEMLHYRQNFAKYQADYQKVKNGQLSLLEIVGLSPVYIPSDMKSDTKKVFFNLTDYEVNCYSHILIRESMRHWICDEHFSEEKCSETMKLPQPLIDAHLRLIGCKKLERHIDEISLKKLPITIAKAKDILRMNGYNTSQMLKDNEKNIQLMCDKISEAMGIQRSSAHSLMTKIYYDALPVSH